ncbi:alpha,alpha-trehalose-phosphate synthase [UDP-forming] 1 [Gossypium raimondii]|uniref:alpha,alpha-trehalose-phosphate synthase [UDP-forming] 1 n=1 Tax=Gossypium raimondii TaxID=29730 RepID=UPI00227C2FB2|nr:alpha,alpha-trehalose-phosphate synthase [UDP-forming] 1 [Gossypium raimondii]
MNLASYEFVACQASNKDFAGAAQSLGAGAILVNPWNVTGVADEREKRHRHNFMHVTSHTSQEWATSFVSELNETIVEAQSRTRRIQPSLLIEVAVDRYTRLNNQLHILGFNATLSEPLDTLGRKGSQINWSQSYIRIYENQSIMCCKRKYEFGKRMCYRDEGIHFFELKYPSEVPASVSPQEPTSVGTSAAGSIAAHLKRQHSMLTVEGNKSYS